MIILYNNEIYYEIVNNNPVIYTKLYLIRKLKEAKEKLHRLQILVAMIQSSLRALEAIADKFMSHTSQ